MSEGGHITHFVNVGTRVGATSPFDCVYWTDDLAIAGSARTRSVLESDVFVAIAQFLGVSDDSTFGFKLVFNQPLPWVDPLEQALARIKETRSRA